MAQIRRHFAQEMEELKLDVLRMGGLTKTAVERAVQALFMRDSDLAEKVIAGDAEIDQLEVDIDRLVLKLLALEQPMARDLRFIIGCMRICTNLERIADQAVNIAERALFLNQRPPLPHQPLVENLAQAAIDMVAKSMAAFSEEDADLARQVCQMDDRADELNVRVLRHYIDYMLNEVRAVERAVTSIIVARCLERVADLATNVAEAIVFIAKGVNIKHYCE